MTVAQVSQITGIPPKDVLRFAGEEGIHVYRAAGRPLLRVADLEAWFGQASNRTPESHQLGAAAERALARELGEER